MIWFCPVIACYTLAVSLFLPPTARHIRTSRAIDCTVAATRAIRSGILLPSDLRGGLNVIFVAVWCISCHRTKRFVKVYASIVTLPESRLDLETHSEAEAERRRKEEEARFGLGWESVGMAAQMVAVSSPAGCDDVNTQVPEMFLKEVNG